MSAEHCPCALEVRNPTIMAAAATIEGNDFGDFMCAILNFNNWENSTACKVTPSAVNPKTIC
jgi:hypothetical protein